MGTVAWNSHGNCLCSGEFRLGKGFSGKFGDVSKSLCLNMRSKRDNVFFCEDGDAVGGRVEGLYNDD